MLPFACQTIPRRPYRLFTEKNLHASAGKDEVDDITGNPGPDGAVACVRRGYGFDGTGTAPARPGRPIRHVVTLARSPRLVQRG